MGFWSSVCDFCSSAVSVAKSVVTAAASFVDTLTPVIKALGIKMHPALQAIATVVSVVGKIFNFIDENEKIEDLGEKVIQAEENDITLEKCGNDFEAYKKRIDEFEIDPKKAEGRDPVEQLSAGIVYLAEGIKQEMPSLQLDSFIPLALSNQEYFTEDRVKAYSNEVIKNGYSFDRIMDYIKDDASLSEGKKAENIIVNAEQKLNPQMSREDIKSQLADLKIPMDN